MPYIPPHDEVNDPAVLGRFVAEHPLALLVTHDGTRPDADAVPLLLREAPSGLELVGHVARANPLWRAAGHRGTALAVFGPTGHYVSPSWYPSKKDHHRVVPTWNYLVVHVWGELEVHTDARWILRAVAQLTNAMEDGRDLPWRVGSAPPDFLSDMVDHIVGVSIGVNRMVGRFKVGAQRTEADRLGALAGIIRDATGPSLGPLLEAMSNPTPTDDHSRGHGAR